MKVITVSKEHYELFACVLGDFGDGGRRVTFEEFLQAMKAIGFRALPNGYLIPRSKYGNKVFMLIKGDRGCQRVPKDTQEQWKCELFKLYGWTADSFAPRRERQAE